ncbi:unnamed protein product [Penicillium salamii]|uniref:Zn(2)-C6 fungal-type domain-containing protein n=1 Tax=Penicillium salamii TaxID=1612424 RepID=A0A9W4NDW5_9EURO|nr:unnamed protein product [Penicillium salamii]CAG8250134.1 unnamed protein product [Penicillium salamii]CAG8366761.1 unnamed protein product [Penicillium salamii]CAG8390828.1 unnamed protein product [Penicillium salamii]CAG8392660.1 unnamed protein product [Penicillium salamii]
MDSLPRSPSPESSNKRINDDASDNPQPKKHRRSRHDPEPDWSALMREKISKSSSRVGQACDRCKLKKMKCTPDFYGCSCCLALNLPCKVTDRVTGETFVRGAAGRMCQEIDRLRQESVNQKQQIVNWQQKCVELQQSLDSVRGRLATPYSDDFGIYEVGAYF